jgi:hypothetical protein
MGKYIQIDPEVVYAGYGFGAATSTSPLVAATSSLTYQPRVMIRNGTKYVDAGFDDGLYPASREQTLNTPGGGEGIMVYPSSAFGGRGIPVQNNRVTRAVAVSFNPDGSGRMFQIKAGTLLVGRY